MTTTRSYLTSVNYAAAAASSSVYAAEYDNKNTTINASTNNSN
jgi:hypothetical protein